LEKASRSFLPQQKLQPRKAEFCLWAREDFLLFFCFKNRDESIINTRGGVVGLCGEFEMTIEKMWL